MFCFGVLCFVVVVGWKEGRRVPNKKKKKVKCKLFPKLIKRQKTTPHNTHPKKKKKNIKKSFNFIFQAKKHHKTQKTSKDIYTKHPFDIHPIFGGAHKEGQASFLWREEIRRVASPPPTKQTSCCLHSPPPFPFSLPFLPLSLSLFFFFPS